MDVLHEIEQRMRAAWDAHNMHESNFWLALKREITTFRAVADAAKRVYQDNADAAAWTELGDALTSVDEAVEP